MTGNSERELNQALIYAQEAAGIMIVRLKILTSPLPFPLPYFGFIFSIFLFPFTLARNSVGDDSK